MSVSLQGTLPTELEVTFDDNGALVMAVRAKGMSEVCFPFGSLRLPIPTSVATRACIRTVLTDISRFAQRANVAWPWAPAAAYARKSGDRWRWGYSREDGASLVLDDLDLNSA